MNGRVYSPETGRFLSPDPLIQAPTYSQSFNRYSYVWNNPLNMIDPSGYAAKGSVVDTESGDSDDTQGGEQSDDQDKTLQQKLEDAGAKIGDIVLYQGKLFVVVARAEGESSGSKTSFAGAAGEQQSSSEITDGGATVAPVNKGAGQTDKPTDTGKINVYDDEFEKALVRVLNTPKGTEIADAVEAEAALASVSINKTKSSVFGVGSTTDLTRKRDFWDMLVRNKYPKVLVYDIYINMNVKDPTFYDINGKKFYPSLDRVIAHELGHLYTKIKSGFIGGNYNESVAIENEIATQLDPSATIRHPTLGHEERF